MKYFTDRPMERVMMELPHTQRDRSPPQWATPAADVNGMERAVSCPATGV